MQKISAIMQERNFEKKEDKMKKSFFIFLFLFVIASTSGICQAADSEMMQWLGGVLANSTTDPTATVSGKAMERVVIPWQVPMFRCPTKERMTIEVVSAAGTFGGSSSSSWIFFGANFQELSTWVKTSLLRQMQSYGPVRNIKMFTGKPVQGDLILEVDLRIVSGKDFYRNSGSSSRSFGGKHYSENSASSSQDGAEKNKVYLTLSPILYRLGENGSKEIVAAPDARISASESEVTSSQEASSSSDSKAYSWRGGNSSNSRSESSSSEWGTDEQMSREQMFDGLVQRLSKQAVALTLQALRDSLQIDRYNSIKDSESSHPTGVVVQDK